MNQTAKSISAEMHQAARDLESVRAVLLKFSLTRKGESYDRQVASLINKLDYEGDRILVELAKSMM